MVADVVVLGSGYAGTGAVKRLESELDSEADITWVSDVDHHFVLHESHRCIRDPSVKEKITFDIAEMKSPATRFVHSHVTEIDTDTREITLAGQETITYDYLLICVGSQSAFFGIRGLEEHAFTLKSLDDALAIHQALTDAARRATKTDPAQVVIGGAGLSGIQSAGEIAEFRDEHQAPIDIHLVEGLDTIFPNNDSTVQAKLQALLHEKDIQIHTGDFIGEVDEDTVYIGEDHECSFDVLLWTGGITGQDAAAHTNLDKDTRSDRIRVASDFQTSNERVFAVGDAALIEQPGREDPAPPTAQAAWQAADVAGRNIVRSIEGKPLEEWTYKDKGTLISVGDKAVAHNVKGLPIDTFGGPAAKALKKTVAARWIHTVKGFTDAAKAFNDM